MEIEVKNPFILCQFVERSFPFLSAESIDHYFCSNKLSFDRGFGLFNEVTGGLNLVACFLIFSCFHLDGKMISFNSFSLQQVKEFS